MAISVPAIETQSLTKSYGQARGIVDLDLRVEEGEIYGFLGPNGSGKITTITIAIIVLMFFLEIFAPILNLPSAVLNLSVFHLYGKPMTEGVKWGSTLTLVTVTLILCAVSLLGLNRRDIAK